MQTRTGLGVDTLYTITRRKKDCAPPPTTSTTSHRNVDRMAADRLLDELAISKKRISSTWSKSTSPDSKCSVTSQRSRSVASSTASRTPTTVGGWCGSTTAFIGSASTATSTSGAWILTTSTRTRFVKWHVVVSIRGTLRTLPTPRPIRPRRDGRLGVTVLATLTAPTTPRLIGRLPTTDGVRSGRPRDGR